MLKILFTSVGRRVELVQAFLNAAREEDIILKIYGVDISMSAPALAYCHEKIQICRISDSEYIPQLMTVCKNEQIDLLIPTIDTDLLLLAQNKEKFEMSGTKVLISAIDKIIVSRDKRYTAAYFESCDLLSPKPVDNIHFYNEKFPCFIKPRDGSSSINAYRVENMEELEEYAKRIPDYIIQPFIKGREYTIDILCDFEGNPIYITPRERLAVRSGEVLKTQIVQDEKMIEESLRLIKNYKPCGPITVQLIRQEGTNLDYFIEINPRFGGGVPLSMKAGADAAKAILKLMQKEHLTYYEKAANDKLIYSRFDQSILVKEDETLQKIQSIEEVRKIADKYRAVIFDLDDTLYLEKDYVQSGYQAIEECLPEIENAAQCLWKAFLKGEPAIDYVLQKAGIFSETKKALCLEKYRFHIPKIELLPGVKELLKQLKQWKIKIGIITDGRPEGQRAKLLALGLEKLVDEIIITDELAGNGNPLRFRKPNDISFRIMKERLNLPYSQMIYIGDNTKKDFLAPLQLGMGAVWFQNKEGLYWKGD